ncbi:MAG: 2-amino-3,7-dideoxy-D-threo-hept-6-ulosonate synthase, partial [Candidatus Kariarchaeaceae archaeon]
MASSIIPNSSDTLKMLTGIGKRVRFRRLIDQETGAIMMVPMDHGFTLGPVPGIANIALTVDQVFQGGASAVVVHKGLVKSLTNVIPPARGLIIHVSGSTALSPNSNYKIITANVPEVVTLGADGISCHVNVGADEDSAMMEDMAKIAEESEDFGLPFLSMMYGRNSEGEEDNSVSTLAHLARLAEELGADVVKVNASPSGKGFDEVIQGTNIPVVIAGGAKKDDFSAFLKTIENCILAGASGVSVGRNIFQAADPMT